MHTTAWMAWVTLVMAIALTTTNPFYLGIVLLCVILVGAMAPKTGTAIAGFRALAFFGATLFVFSIGIATINGNTGTHILFTTPAPDFPSWLGGLRIGGPVSAEGLLAATIRGLTILSIFLAFAVFNGAVSGHRVLRTAPAALFHAGLVVTVGLTLLPASIEDLRRLREMRALRGGRTGPRQLPSLVVPAVINGLERSMRLAEAMEARGYAAADPLPRWARLAGTAGAPFLLAAAWGWYYYEPARPFAVIAALAGVAALAAWALGASRTRHTTQLRNEPLTRTDAIARAGSLLLAVLLIGLAIGGWNGAGYNPFDGLPWPRFELVGASLALLCAWPAVRLFFEPRPAGAARPSALEEAHQL